MHINTLAAALSLVTFAHAWPWPHAFGGDSVDGLFKRQNAATPSQTATSPQATQTNNNANSQSRSNTASVTLVGTSVQSLSPSASKASENGTTVFDPRDPAGGIAMITPNVMQGAQYYKIGDWVHFAWNYTSLQATPTAINVVATCSQNQATYTLASNQTVGETGEIYWDTGAYQAKADVVPLLTNQYTLIVWDAAQPITATPRAGYLGAYQQFTFGMYTPLPYSDWKDFSCPTCNKSGAVSLERMTLTFLLAMSSITVLTFTWFTSSLRL